MQHFVITIGREFGSKGKAIAEILGKMLNINVYEKELVELAAKRNQVSLAKYLEVDEIMSKKSVSFFSIGNSKQLKLARTLFDTQAEIIKELAEKESCIFVGRCANYVLRERTDCINIYITSPYGARYNNLLNECEMTFEATERMIMEMDSSRKNYYKFVTNQENRLQAKNNHVVIDSSLLGTKATAEVLYDIVSRKYLKD